MHSDLKNFLYDGSRGFIFSYVPKVACSNWKCVMRYLAGHENYLDTKFAHDRTINGLDYVDQQPDPWALLEDDAVRKISCVRSPYSRSLSAYLNKIEFNLPKMTFVDEPKDLFLLTAEKIELFRRETLDTSKYPKVNFEVFLRWLVAGPQWLTRDEHWAPQSEMLMLERVKYDYIGRFENLEKDAPKILAMMGCDIDFPTQKQIRFAPTQASSKLAEYYTDSARALVEEIFAKDFDLLGYERRLPQ